MTEVSLSVSHHESSLTCKLSDNARGNCSSFGGANHLQRSVLPSVLTQGSGYLYFLFSAVAL